MNRLFRLLLPAATPLLAALCLGVADALPALPMSHPAPNQRIKFDTRKFIPVSEIKPGMRGYALTVFKGTTITKYHVEVLGVMSNYYQGKDFIMFRILDGPPVTRHLNVAHGMSGSPVYIGGRLAGAISMGYQFSKDPIGFATPIEDMLDAWSPDLPSQTSSISATADNGRGTRMGATAMAPTMDSEQMDVPVTLSGVPRSFLPRFQSILGPYHMSVMAGAGGGTASQNPLAKGATLQPGSAVGVALVQGDMDFNATGTLTYRDGDRVLLFGHPFMGLGPINAALTTAYVVDIFPSYQDAVILGSPIKTIGRVFQDRPFSVGGQIGPLPQMIPMTVDVNDLSIKRRKVFHLQVVNHPLLTGQLVPQLAGAAISQIHGQPGDSVATVTMDADVEQIGHVKRTNTFYDAVSIDQSATEDLDSLMHLLSSNPFYPLALKSLTMGVTIQNRHDTAELDHIFLKQGQYAPGDTVTVGVVLKPYKRDPITRYVAVKIPSTVQNGTLTLSVKGGGTDSGGGISLGGGLILLRPSEPLPPAGNVGQLVKQFTEKPRNNELIARLILPTSAINIDGEKFTTLPPTLASIMQATRTSGLKTERDEVKVVQETPYIVSGSQALSVTIQKKSVGDTSSPSSVAPPAPPVPPSTETASADSSVDDENLDDAARASSLAPPTGGELMAIATRLIEAAPPPVRSSRITTTAGTTSSGPVTVLHSTVTTQTETPPPAKPLPLKTVGRLASVWRQGTATDFAAGTLQNVSVTSTGDVRLSASLTKLGETGETYLWALLPDGRGHVYAGTGDHGYVYKMDASGKPTLFFKTGQLEVTALAQDAQGNLYAGTSPHGIVYKIGPDGKGGPCFTAPDKYVTALAYDDTRKRLYVATGGGTGHVFAVPAEGKPSPKALFTSPEAHLLSLALDADGNIYAGSSPDGIVYKITPTGTSQVLYDAPDQSISALTLDSAGNIYAGTMPKGTIYKITQDGYGKILSDKATSGILGLRTDKDDDLYACAGNTVYRISPDETVQSFVAPTDEQFLSLAVDRSTSQVYTGTATVGSVYTIGASGDLRGQFTSTVHDAGLPAHWGTISWATDTPPGTGVVLQTRSGDVARPDDSWSAWSPSYTTALGQKITSPPGRYLQYQALLTGSATATGQGSVPRLREVTVYYLPRNQAPTVKLLSPAEGDALSKAALIRWTAGDPDQDTLTFDLSYSSNGSKIWTPIKKKTAPQTVTPTAPLRTTSAVPTGPVTDQEVAAEVAKMKASLAAHPEVPSSVRAQILAQAPALARQALTMQRSGVLTTGTNTGAASGLKEQSYSWDTTTVPDGMYQLQIVASDKSSNPVGALTAKSVSPPFLIANSTPTLTADTPTVGKDKSVTIHGIVTSRLAFVKAVQAKVDGGDAIAAISDDGLFDSASESFTLVTPPLTSGAHTLELQTVDQAGNLATKTISVQVP